MTVDGVIREICNIFEVDYKKIMGRDRTFKIKTVRFLCWYVLHKTKLLKTKVEIGRLFNRNHATIINGLNQVDGWLEL